jgi:hypothetical protein
VEHIVTLAESNTSINTLELEDNQFSGTGANALAAFLGKSKGSAVSRLFLRGNAIPLESLTVLARAVLVLFGPSLPTTR